MIASLPWGVVTDFLTLEDILSGRSVSRDWKLHFEDNVSMDWCQTNLSMALRRSNCLLVPPSGGATLDASWDKDATQEKLRSVFVMDQGLKTDKKANGTEINHWRQFLLCMRLMKSIPQSVTIAFSEEDGRHCIAQDQSHSEPPSQSWFSGIICSAWASDASAKNEDNSSTKNNKPDMSEQQARSINNLPAGIQCPNCHSDDGSSLVLGDFSYKSTPDPSTLRLLHDVLTFTPYQESLYSTASIHTGENLAFDPNAQFSSPPPSKKRKLGVGAEVSFPPRYAEMADTMRDAPVRLPTDAKFGISIHCTKCRDFAVIAPAAVCWHSDFVCHQRGRVIYRNGKEITLGGALVRSKCSAPSCQKAVSCPDCSHRTWHDPYSRGGCKGQVARSSHCVMCNETYCSDHAWISTMCHNW